MEADDSIDSFSSRFSKKKSLKIATGVLTCTTIIFLVATLCLAIKNAQLRTENETNQNVTSSPPFTPVTTGTNTETTITAVTETTVTTSSSTIDTTPTSTDAGPPTTQAL